MHLRAQIFSFSGLLFPLVLSAGLVFEQDSRTVESQWGDERVQASFHFVNKGESTVYITDVRTSCGCTAAKPAQSRFEPGESGQIDAEFVIGSRQGTQRNRIHVQTSAGDHGLYLTVGIPVSWTIDNRILVWRAHEQKLAKEARIVVNDPRIHSVELVDPNGILWNTSIDESDGVWVLSAIPRKFEPQQRQVINLRMLQEDGSMVSSINLFLRML